MKAFGEEIRLVAMGRTDWTRSGDQAGVAAGLKGRWRGGEKQLDWGVFWRFGLQDCSGVGYRR